MAKRPENFHMPRQALIQYGDWIREKELGSGAFGTVYMWKNKKENKEIAVKKCKSVNSEAMRRWQTEMKMIEDMKHPNIVSFVKIPEELEVEYPKRCSLGMEYCSMGDLRKFIAKIEHLCGLPEHHVIDVMGDIGSAIKYLHGQKNMHRDLKPENIVLKPRENSNTRFLFKITDLGYAKDLNLASCGHSFVGTLAYLAPEVAMGNEKPSYLRYYTQVDYWSFGLVVFECITGYRPFLANSSTPIKAFSAIKGKKDDEIYAWMDTKPKEEEPRFQKEIPKPHQLNPYLTEEITQWLRLMLRVDEKKRGGAGEEWYRLLMDRIVGKKFAKVLNVSNMSVIAFPLDENTYIRALQMKIHSEAKIAPTEQLLLFAKGKVPETMKRIAEQVNLNSTLPEETTIYLFDKAARDWPNFASRTPPAISNYHNPKKVEPQDRYELRLMQITLDDILNKINTGILFHGALVALLERVAVMSRNLREKLQEFSGINENTAGKVDLFEISLKKDMAENNAQDNSSEICTDKAFREQCEDMVKEVQEWKAELEKGRMLIKDAEKQLNVCFTESSKRRDFYEALVKLRNESIKFCEGFRVEWKRFDRRNRSQNVSHNEIEKTFKQFRVKKLKEFMDEYWLKAKKLLEDELKPSSDLRKMMRFYVSQHTKLETIYFDMTGRTHQYNCITSDIKERQESRQHDIWNMLQYMKDVYKTAFTYEKDVDAPAELEEQVFSLQSLMDTVMLDEDLAAVSNFVNPGPMPNVMPHPSASSQQEQTIQSTVPYANGPNLQGQVLPASLPNALPAEPSSAVVRCSQPNLKDDAGSHDPSNLRMSELAISAKSSSSAVKSSSE